YRHATVPEPIFLKVPHDRLVGKLLVLPVRDRVAAPWRRSCAEHLRESILLEVPKNRPVNRAPVDEDDDPPCFGVPDQTTQERDTVVPHEVARRKVEDHQRV